MMEFDVYEDVEEMEPCMKRPLVVHCKEMNVPFTVKTLEGPFEGKPGDFLMKGIDGELYICDRDIFLRTYDIME